METVTISKQSFGKILDDIEILIADVERLSEEDVVKKRRVEIDKDVTIGKTEEELNQYLKKRGVRVD